MRLTFQLVHVRALLVQYAGYVAHDREAIRLLVLRGLPVEVEPANTLGGAGDVGPRSGEYRGMRMWSVGFRVLNSRDPTRQEKELAAKLDGVEPQWVATRAELLETSAVPVPADPHAGTLEKQLAAAAARGLDVSAIRSAWRPELVEVEVEVRDGETIETAVGNWLAERLVTSMEQKFEAALQRRYRGETV